MQLASSPSENFNPQGTHPWGLFFSITSLPLPWPTTLVHSRLTRYRRSVWLAVGLHPFPHPLLNLLLDPADGSAAGSDPDRHWECWIVLDQFLDGAGLKSEALIHIDTSSQVVMAIPYY
jgi:hypothetical protein